MAISFNTFLGVFHIHSQKFEFGKYFGFDGHFVISHNQSLGIIIVGMLFPPPMLFHSINFYPFLRIHCQNFPNEILQLKRKSTRESVVSLNNLFVQFRNLFVFEGQTSAHHCIQNNACTPNVNHQGFIRMLRFDHFWGCVAWGSACSFESLVLFVSITQTEIYNPYSVIIIHKNIFKFEISVNNSKFVNILNATDDLFKDFACFIFRHCFLTDNVVKKLSFFHQFHDKKEVLGGLDNFIELNDIWMSYKFENMNFPGHTFNISYINNLVLLEHLDGYFFSSDCMSGQFYLAKCPFAKGLL